MAAIPSLPVETAPELMQAVRAIVDADPDLTPITDDGVKTCLQQIARALQSTVNAIVTMKNIFVSETGSANVNF